MNNLVRTGLTGFCLLWPFSLESTDIKPHQGPDHLTAVAFIFVPKRQYFIRFKRELMDGWISLTTVTLGLCAWGGPWLLPGPHAAAAVHPVCYPRPFERISLSTVQNSSSSFGTGALSQIHVN